MAKDMHPENTPANLLLAEIGALRNAVRSLPKSKRLAAAREALPDAKRVHDEAAAALNAYHIARGDRQVVDDPELTRLENARNKAHAGIEAARRKVQAARVENMPLISAHLQHHSGQLR